MRDNLKWDEHGYYVDLDGNWDRSHQNMVHSPHCKLEGAWDCTYSAIGSMSSGDYYWTFKGMWRVWREMRYCGVAVLINTN